MISYFEANIFLMDAYILMHIFLMCKLVALLWFYCIQFLCEGKSVESAEDALLLFFIFILVNGDFLCTL